MGRDAGGRDRADHQAHLVGGGFDAEAGKRRQVAIERAVVPKSGLAATDAPVPRLNRKADAVVPAGDAAVVVGDRTSAAMGTTLDGASFDWSFGPVGLQLQYGFGGGVYAGDVIHYKTATMLGADLAHSHYYLEGFKMAFEARGGKVIQEAYYPEATTNMVPFLTALNNKADVLVYWGDPGDCFAMFPQYKELNMKLPILMPEDGGVLASPGMLKNLGPAAIGSVFGSSYLYNANYPGNKEFVEAYQKKYNELPGVMAGVGYAHVQMLMAVLKATGGDAKPDALYKALKAVSVDTVRGHLRFPQGSGPFGTVANLPYIMGKIGPNFTIEPIVPVNDIQVNYKDKKFLPFVAK